MGNGSILGDSKNDKKTNKQEIEQINNRSS